jgi:HAD superfamily hydrolase (TIGR01509 family)
MIRGLIFDFDGLILDTELPEFEAWQSVYAEHGAALTLEAWSVCIGTGPDAFDAVAELEKQIGRSLDRVEVRRRHKARSLSIINAQPILPGVLEVLADAKARGLKLGVASTSERAWVAGHLERLGLIERFDCLCCGDEVENVKPAPDLYLAALDCLGLKPDEAIAFEDSPNGVLAARRAGLYCVAVPNPITRHLPLEHASRRIASLADLSLGQLLAELDNHKN